jgi:predicted RNase H-related nuclease YkuK (DUF458 family)
MMKGERKPGATAVFRDHRGEAVADPKEYVKTWLKAHPGGRVYVGCDSKVRGSRVKYSTAICMWNIGKGVKEIYKNEVEKRPPDRYSRLWSEVTRAVYQQQPGISLSSALRCQHRADYLHGLSGRRQAFFLGG